MTRRLPGMLVATAALATFGLGACGGGGSKSCDAKVDTKSATAGAVTVCAGALSFDVSTIKATPGPLKVTFDNRGNVYHTFKINGTSLEIKANAGKSETGTVTLAKGTYEFECTVPGHKAAGMKGKVVVG